jgi:hypothetical protein
MRGLGRATAPLIIALSAIGCATDGPPEVGTRGWHELRIAEIEDAKTRGELTTEQYISLKNEADATRAAYRAALQAPNYYYGPMFWPSPFFHHHH